MGCLMVNTLFKVQRWLAPEVCFVLLLGFSLVQCSRSKNAQATKLARMEQLAVQNDSQALIWLANNYRSGEEGVPKDPAKALFWDQKAADQKIPDAQYSMAVRFEDGDRVEKNLKMAIKWYEACANNGFGKWQSEAQASLGLRYLEGNGVIQDFVKAYEWITKSALQGNAPSIFFISDWHLKKSDKQDQLLGRVMLETAASRGLPQAQFRLALYYSDGKLVQPDYSLAATWARKASEQGYAKAQCMLGNFLLEGMGVDIDEKQAAVWITKAAEQGDSEAQALVAKLYTQGRGVPADKSLAKMWIKKWAFGVLSKAEQDYKNSRISVKELKKIRETAAQVEKLP